MEVQISWLAVILAAFSTMVVGFIWYAPQVFGNEWMKLAKIDPKKGADPKVAIAITLIVSFLSAYVLAHVIGLSDAFFKDNSHMQNSLTTAFWVWLGFTAARFITHDAFENRRKKLTLLNISNEFVTFMVMGLVIGLIQV